MGIFGRREKKNAEEPPRLPEKPKALVDQRLDLSKPETANPQISAMASAPALKILAVGGPAGKITLFDSTAQAKKAGELSLFPDLQKKTSWQREDGVFFLRFSADQTYLAAATAKEVVVYSTKDWSVRDRAAFIESDFQSGEGRCARWLGPANKLVHRHEQSPLAFRLLDLDLGRSSTVSLPVGDSPKKDKSIKALCATASEGLIWAQEAGPPQDRPWRLFDLSTRTVVGEVYDFGDDLKNDQDVFLTADCRTGWLTTFALTPRQELVEKKRVCDLGRFGSKAYWITAEGRTVILATHDYWNKPDKPRSLFVFRPETGQVRTADTAGIHTLNVEDVCFLDASRLATYDESGRLVIWNIEALGLPRPLTFAEIDAQIQGLGSALSTGLGEAARRVAEQGSRALASLRANFLKSSQIPEIMGEIGDPSSFKLLAGMLETGATFSSDAEQGPWLGQVVAARALGKLGDPAALPLLQEVERSTKSAEVMLACRQAVDALNQLRASAASLQSPLKPPPTAADRVAKDKQITHLIVELAKGPNRRETREKLESLDPYWTSSKGADEARPSLIDLTGNPDPVVAENAGIILDMIQRKA